MELEAQLNMLSERRTDLQEAYVDRDLLSFENRERLMEYYEQDGFLITLRKDLSHGTHQ